MLLLTACIKLIAEIALMAFAGQGVLALITGAQRQHNPVYRLLQWATQPFVRAARWLSPRVVLDRHVPLVAVALLLAVWLAATLTRIEHCLRIGIELCR